MVRGRLRNFVNIVAQVRGVESSMLLRVAVVCACVLGVGISAPVWPLAEELGPEQARAFVVGKLFAYSCFDGTAGIGRIFADGSVVGTIRIRGQRRDRASPPCRPARSGSTALDVRASVRACRSSRAFRVQKIDYRSFRGSIAGLGFAYCDFHQRNPRAQLLSQRAEPRRQRRRSRHSRPMLRPSLRPSSRFAAFDDSHSRSSRNGVASAAMTPRPMVSIAATMRPSRPSSRSASETMRIFGVAVGEARRSACAMLVLVAMRIERADAGEGARGRAADAGEAMHHERRAAVPAAHEIR